LLPSVGVKLPPFTVTFVVVILLVQPFTVTLTLYNPLIPPFTFGTTGFFNVLVKPPGPDHI